MGKTRPLFVYFHSFHTKTINDKSVDGFCTSLSWGHLFNSYALMIFIYDILSRS